MHLSRRSLLQALTVGAGSIAFGPGRLGGRIARADPNSVPGRLVIFPVAVGGGIDPNVSSYASCPDYPAPTYRGQTVTPGTSTNVTVGPILQPFADRGLQSQLVFMRGLEYRPPFYADAHLTGAACMLTGSANQASDGSISPVNQSIDQYLATKIGAGMPWPSLVMSLAGACASFDANLNAIYGLSDPLDIYSKVFSNLATGPSPALLSRLARRKSVLDAVSTDLNAFMKRLPTEDRMRAEAQTSAIAALEAQLSQTGGSACTAPTIDQNDQDYTTDQNMMPNTVRAWSRPRRGGDGVRNQTRVVTMYTTVAYNSLDCGYDPVDQPDSNHHPLSHGTDNSGTGNPSGQSVWLTERQFLHQLVAELALKLQNIPEAGGTMLDNTIIVIPSENGVVDGHNYYDLCWTTVGGKGLGVKTGQYMNLGTVCDNGSAVPVQRLFVSLLNALGLPDQTFNDDPSASTGSGPLPGYLA